MLRPFRKFVSVFFAINSLISAELYAGVVVNGTRVIFEANQTEKSVKLDNRDRHPNLVQIWTDTGNEELNIETADGPFLTNPQIFKINPNQSQIVRLNFIGDVSKLPQDKESLFFLNVNEIPALKSSDLAKNRLVVSFTNRLKIFYRPKGIQGQSIDVVKQVSYSIQDQSIRLKNASNYYANISEIKIIKNGKVLNTRKSLLIPPQGQIDWDLKGSIANAVNSDIKAVFINDYGGAIHATLATK